MDPNERLPPEPRSSPLHWPDEVPGDQRPAPPPQADFMPHGFAIALELVALLAILGLLAVNVAVGVFVALVAAAAGVGVVWQKGIFSASDPEPASRRTSSSTAETEIPREAIALGLGAVVVLVVLFRLNATLGLIVLIIGAIAIFYLHSTGILRRRQVVDRWDALLVASSGNAPAVLEHTIATLTAMEVPDITWHMERLAPGWARGFAGDTRPFLIVTHTRNRRLKPFKVFLNIRDYGTSLQTSWFLAYQPGFRRRALALTGAGGLGLDLFDEQDLRAYVTAVHHAFIAAVVKLLSTLGQDASSLNRNSKGFLGIS